MYVLTLCFTYSMYTDLECAKIPTLSFSCQEDVGRLNGITSNLPETTCWEGLHLICLPAGLPLPLCHIKTFEMSFSPSSLTDGTCGKRQMIYKGQSWIQIWQ